MATLQKTTQPPPKQPKLLEQVRNALRVKQYKYTTEKEYVRRVREFIFYHNKRHPAEMGAAEIVELIIDERSLSTDTAKRAPNTMIRQDVKPDEVLLGRTIKSFGGKWDQEKGAWELPYKQVLALGLEKRIVATPQKMPQVGNIRKRASL